MFSNTSLMSNENDSNVDANSLLTELDKGLRSLKSGEQCESIVRFPALFERYPFPILINSASLKLSEVYRNGSNFLRVLILEVMRESEKHLDKIVNIDEFVRRIFCVTFCNDCTARTITLLMMSSITRIVANRKTIHHYIRNSLDSNDSMEVLAAIEASASFAEKSQEFAANIYPKIVSMINGLTTPLEIKINLLSVLRNVHFNSEIADDVRLNCIKFLPTYPSEKFVCTDLKTLTQIASISLTQIPDQIDLLLKYFINDSRINVKLSVLQDLKFLASMSPHLWQKTSTNTLVDSILTLNDNNSNKSTALLCRVLSVFAQLVSSPTIFANEPQFYSEICSKITNFCLQIVYSEQNIELISTCICILTNISLNLNSNCVLNVDVIQETCCAIQAFLLSNINSNELNYENVDKISLKTIFKCILSLCQSNKFLFITQMTETLRFVILNVKMESIWFGMSCEVICAIASTITINGDLFAEDVLSLITTSSQNKSIGDESNFIKLFTIFFQMRSSTTMSEAEAQTLSECFNGRNLWSCFKVIRQAMRFGHHLIASLLLNKLKAQLEPIENIHFWINSLTSISTAESLITKNNEEIEKNLCTSISLYIEGMTDLKASISPNYPMKFECEFVKLRLKYLQNHYYFRQCCQLIRTSPPPAIAASTALSTRDDMLKCGNIVIAMRKNAKEFRSVAESYSLLYQSSFNADNNTLAQIQLLQHSCVILAEAIENLFQSNRLNSLFVSKETPFKGDSNKSTLSFPLEHRALIEMCSKISNLIHIHLNGMQTNDLIGSKQISLLEKVSSEILKVPLCFPRYFFQAIQNTCIKLAISPQPKPGDVLVINNSTHFVLRIEGVVVNNKCQKLIRKVGKVLISVNGILISRSSNNTNDQLSKISANDANLSLQSVVVPLNDYFQVQFLLSLTVIGLYNINIETSIIDENEAQWKTGPNLSLSAKVIEDQAMASK